MQNIKRDNELMRILDLKEISRVICNTDKSYFTLKLRKGETVYWLYLDSVPLSKEDNKECMELLFPMTDNTVYKTGNVGMSTSVLLEKRDMSNPKDWDKTILVPKKSGRPKGSKNK